MIEIAVGARRKLYIGTSLGRIMAPSWDTVVGLYRVAVGRAYGCTKEGVLSPLRK
jgi:hypothetical protein